MWRDVKVLDTRRPRLCHTLSLPNTTEQPLALRPNARRTYA